MLMRMFLEESGLWVTGPREEDLPSLRAGILHWGSRENNNKRITSCWLWAHKPFFSNPSSSSCLAFGFRTLTSGPLRSWPLNVGLRATPSDSLVLKPSDLNWARYQIPWLMLVNHGSPHCSWWSQSISLINPFLSPIICLPPSYLPIYHVYLSDLVMCQLWAGTRRSLVCVPQSIKHCTEWKGNIYGKYFWFISFSKLFLSPCFNYKMFSSSQTLSLTIFCLLTLLNSSELSSAPSLMDKHRRAATFLLAKSHDLLGKSGVHFYQYSYVLSPELYITNTNESNQVNVLFVFFEQLHK